MKKIAVLLRLWVTCSFIFLIAACYGAPMDYPPVDNTVNNNIDVHTTDASGKPIRGLKISDYTNNVFIKNLFTDSTGNAVFSNAVDLSHTLIVEDMDGTNNGGTYAPQTNTSYPGNDIDVTMR